MAFLLLLTGAVIPRVGAELNFTSINNDGVEAQYAAEAGVKYAAAQILNNTSNTDWSWARGNQELTFADGETYKITIYPIDSSGKAGSSPIEDGIALTSGSKYLIQSVGKVNNYSKTVKVIAYINTGSDSSPAIYAGNTANIGNSLKVINGDVLAANIKISTLPTLDDDKNIYYYNKPTVGTDIPVWMIGNQWYDGPLKNKLKPWSGNEYVFTPDATTITSLPAFSAATNISSYTQNYSSGISLPSPQYTSDNGFTTYTLSANTKYYLSSGMPSPIYNGTLKFSKPDNGYVVISIYGDYYSNSSGNGTIINFSGTGNLVFNVIGKMEARAFTINAPNADNIVINVIVAEQDFIETIDGKWIQTSYNTRGGVHYDTEGGIKTEDQTKAMRKNYAGIGFFYDSELDAFIPPKVFESFVLDEDTCLYVAPIPKPDDGKMYYWDEEKNNWEERMHASS